jgi:hypothetical protein
MAEVLKNGTLNGHAEEFSDAEAWELFDRQAQRFLKMDGKEFIRMWDAGEFDDPDDRSKHGPEVMRVATLLPLVR